MRQQPMPEFGLGFRDDLVGLRQLLDVVNAGPERVAVGLRSADPEHVQDDLGILRIVLVPAVVQRLSGAPLAVAAAGKAAANLLAREPLLDVGVLKRQLSQAGGGAMWQVQR